MSGPTCCCSVSLDRCDLLVSLEGFHLMSVTRTPGALVLDVESCNQLVGCPGCGVTYSRPRARLGVRAIRWEIRQLRFEGATIAGLVRQLATTWNTVWSHIKPCLRAASDDPARFAGLQVLGVDEHVWHHQDRRRRGPVSSLASWTTRGEEHPMARLLDLVPGRRSWPAPRHVYSPTVDAWRHDRSSTGAQAHDHAAFSPRPPRGCGNTLTRTAQQRGTQDAEKTPADKVVHSVVPARRA